ncbi:hypothetical protein [Candidatus Erwinia haradaeae]|nr:hypothetical protein [Candidatus Erwinia haradaeae]
MLPYGFLRSLADQGVLLLNGILIVKSEKPRSYAHFGLDIFINKMI